MEKESVISNSPRKKPILASARKQLLEKGFHGASIRKTTSDAGFIPGALYGYFSSKEELFYALTDPLIGRSMKKWTISQPK